MCIRNGLGLDAPGTERRPLAFWTEITTISKHRCVSPMDFAVVYAGLGDADSTFHSTASSRTPVTRTSCAARAQQFLALQNARLFYKT